MGIISLIRLTSLRFPFSKIALNLVKFPGRLLDEDY
jgi:hypothetical protein